MTGRATLRAVPPPQPAPPKVADIYAQWRCDIAARDWDACHVRGDRNPPVDLPDRPKRGRWR